MAEGDPKKKEPLLDQKTKESIIAASVEFRRLNLILANIADSLSSIVKILKKTIKS